VLRRVDVEQDQPLGLQVLLGRAGAHPDERALLVAGEQLGVQRDGPDVGVAGDGPEAVVVEAGAAAGLGVPPDRRGAAQLGQLGQRHAAGVEVRVGEVEPVRDAGSGHWHPPSGTRSTRVKHSPTPSGTGRTERALVAVENVF
jgi:hypothetical protein